MDQIRRYNEYMNAPTLRRLQILGEDARVISREHFCLCSNRNDPKHPLVCNKDCVSMESLDVGKIFSRALKRGHVVAIAEPAPACVPVQPSNSLQEGAFGLFGFLRRANCRSFSDETFEHAMNLACEGKEVATAGSKSKGTMEAHFAKQKSEEMCWAPPQLDWDDDLLPEIIPGDAGLDEEGYSS